MSKKVNRERDGMPWLPKVLSTPADSRFL